MAVPFPPPSYLPNPGIEPTSPVSPALADGFFTTELGKPLSWVCSQFYSLKRKIPLEGLGALGRIPALGDWLRHYKVSTWVGIFT